MKHPDIRKTFRRNVLIQVKPLERTDFTTKHNLKISIRVFGPQLREKQ